MPSLTCYPLHRTHSLLGLATPQPQEVLKLSGMLRIAVPTLEGIVGVN